jgi:hypothetical protein
MPLRLTDAELDAVFAAAAPRRHINKFLNRHMMRWRSPSFGSFMPASYHGSAIGGTSGSAVALLALDLAHQLGTQNQPFS